MATPLPPKREQSPPHIFGHVYCGKSAKRLDGSRWYKIEIKMEVGLSPSDFVLDGDPAPLQKGGRARAPQFSAHFYCGQTAGCIKMPLGMEVVLSLGGDFVLDGDPAPLPKRGLSPQF